MNRSLSVRFNGHLISLEKNTGFQVIGYLIYQPAAQSITSSIMARNAKPAICVCMGSTGDWNKLDFLNKTYYSRYTIVTGDQNKVLSAAHIISRDFVNLNQLLKTCSLMIAMVAMAPSGKKRIWAVCRWLYRS